ncbi:MAG: hypothetical protein HW388_1694 [Dehalococcoidia bacterium]|nr:hypothetical protein [Dehalococcoidia bacterium]
MPKGSRRVAVRQAELSSQRKRRPQKHPSNPEPLPAPAPQDGVTPPAEMSRRAASPQAPATAAPRRTPRGNTPSITSQPSSGLYVWPEMKRIGLLTGLILVILAILTVVLG